MYDAIINNDYDKVMQETTNAAMQYFTINILKKYVAVINSMRIKPLLLGVYHGNREILIWSEINDDDDNTESQLFIAEAKVNASFIESGIFLNTTIVEKSDKIKMPKQYKLLYPNA